MGTTNKNKLYKTKKPFNILDIKQFSYLTKNTTGSKGY